MDVARLLTEIEQHLRVGAGQSCERHIHDDAQNGNDTLATVGRKVTDTRVVHRGDGRRTDLLAGDRDPSRQAGRVTRQSPGKVGFAGAKKTGDAQDFSGAQGEAHGRERASQSEIANVEHDLGLRRALKGFTVKELLARPADHAFMQCAFRHIRDRHRGDDGTILKHIEPITELQHFREAMRYIDDRRAFACFCDQIHQEGDFISGQRRGRLVEQHDGHFNPEQLSEGEGLDDLDDLAGRKIEVLNLPRDIDAAMTEFLEPSRDASAHGAIVDGAEAAESGLVREQYVLIDRQRRDEREVLIDVKNAGAIGVLIAPKLDFAPARGDRTRVGFQVSADDLQESRLAGAVFADKPNDLSLVEGEANVRQRRLSAEGLADSLEVEDAARRGSSASRRLNMGQ